jgi:FlaG/FlaF family flagellin (archaellin)
MKKSVNPVVAIVVVVVIVVIVVAIFMTVGKGEKTQELTDTPDDMGQKQMGTKMKAKLGAKMSGGGEDTGGGPPAPDLD